MTKTLISFLISMTLSSFVSAAEDENTGQAISVNVENDSQTLAGPGTDRAYTSGVRISYVYAENEIPDWSKDLLNISDKFWQKIKSSNTNVGMALGQQIYTPGDTQNPNVVVGDRPYAGWLYLALTVQIRNSQRLHIVEADIGVIGPASLGEQAQNGLHRAIGVPTTKGWANQLETEPTAQLFYQQREKFLSLWTEDKVKYFDVIPYFGGSLGNVYIDAHVGGLARLGIHLPGDFGPSGSSSKNGDTFVLPTKDPLPTSVYLFIGAKANAIARDLFLDGNTFRSSYSVGKNSFVTESEIGVGFVVYRWGLIYRYVNRSPEIAGSTQFDNFASISISRSF
jgi:lipid A 3-O-deacylase